MTAPRIEDIPDHPLVYLMVTSSDHRAYMDNRPVEVSPGTDPRVSLAAAAVVRARELGRPVRAILHDADNLMWQLIITPDGGVFQSTRPLPVPLPVIPAVSLLADDEPEPVAAGEAVAPAAVLEPDPDPEPATVVPSAPSANGQSPIADPHEAQHVRAVREENEARPPEGVDPGSVPAWPLVRITLTEEGKAFVNDEPVEQPDGMDARPAAVVAAAALIGQLGLARAVRAAAVDPDGTTWPLIIHPNGTSTAAGDPVRPEHGQRWKRGRTRD